MHARLLLLPCLTLTRCAEPTIGAGSETADDTSTTAGTTTGTSSTSGTDAVTDTGSVDAACECFDSTQCDGVEVVEACSVVVASCAGSCSDTPAVINDIEALDCTLAALRDRTPGLVSWRTSQDTGHDVDSRYFLLMQNGTALHSSQLDVDSCIGYGPNNHVTLRDAAYFSGCIDQSAPVDRFNCMKDAVQAVVFECTPEDAPDCETSQERPMTRARRGRAAGPT